MKVGPAHRLGLYPCKLMLPLSAAVVGVLVILNVTVPRELLVKGIMYHMTLSAAPLFLWIILPLGQ